MNVLSVPEADMLSASDEEHLTFALEQGRVIFTHDDVILKLAASKVEHAGIVYSSQQLIFSGTRVPVDVLIDYLKAGEPLDRFLEGFPTVKREQAEAFLQEAVSVKSWTVNCSVPLSLDR